MTRVSGFCCLPVNIAVRLIGSTSLLINIFVFIILVSNLNEVLIDDKIRIIFGFDSEFFSNGNQYNYVEWYPTLCLAFTLTAAVSSVLLIWASVIVNGWLTIPWLICTVLNVISHFTCLVMLSFRRSDTSEWITAVTVLYSVALVYFLLVVTIANYFWWIQSSMPFRKCNNQEPWKGVHKSSPIFESLYKNRV